MLLDASQRTELALHLSLGETFDNWSLVPLASELKPPAHLCRVPKRVAAAAASSTAAITAAAADAGLRVESCLALQLCHVSQDGRGCRVQAERPNRSFEEDHPIVRPHATPPASACTTRGPIVVVSVDLMCCHLDTIV